MSPKDIKSCGNLAVITMGYDNQCVMPLTEAMQLMVLLEKAEQLRTKWVSGGGSTAHIGGTPDVKVALMGMADYARIKMNGDYPEDK